MDSLQAARDLGTLLQKDERFLTYAKAKLAVEDDKTVNEMIGEFNLTRMNLERLLDDEQKDEEKAAKLNQNLRGVYDRIMANDTMKRYNDAKAVLDKMMEEVYAILRMSAEGEDPQTCVIPESGCSGDCASCGSCH